MWTFCGVLLQPWRTFFLSGVHVSRFFWHMSILVYEALQLLPHLSWLPSPSLVIQTPLAYFTIIACRRSWPPDHTGGGPHKKVKASHCSGMTTCSETIMWVSEISKVG